MHEVINSELGGCTVLAVAHRIGRYHVAHSLACINDTSSIATIIDYDWILVMHEGKIVESGPPGELLSSPTTKFSSLAASQGILRRVED